jgi:ubiquinone/menaquinone biosynthesis C-methylase UbiE
MPDVYSTIDQADREVVMRLADVLERGAADPQQRAMLEDYLTGLPLPAGARILEVGCGPGPISRTLATRPNAGEIVGIDRSPIFIEHARAAANGIPNVSFVCGDGRDLPFDDGSFDAVICHTSLCHIPGPAEVLAEAHRVTAAGATRLV